MASSDGVAAGPVKCPGCDFLVPRTWLTCKRCGMSLTREPAPAVVSVPSASVTVGPAAAVPVARADTATPPAAPPAPTGFVPSRVTDDRKEERPTSENEPAVDPYAQYAAPATLSYQWHPPVESVRRRSSIGIKLVALVLSVGALFAGWRLVGFLLAPQVDADTKAYADAKTGEVFRSAAGGYRVTLPGTYAEETMSVSESGYTVSANVVMGELDHFAAGVMWFDIPPGVPQPDGSELFAAGLHGAADETDGEIVEQEETSFLGRPAQDAVIKAPEGYGRIRIFVVDRRVYALIAASPHRSTPGFDRLADSFELTGHGVSSGSSASVAA